MTLTRVVAAIFFLAGVAKLCRARPLAEQFEEFGLPPWTMLVVGGLEIAGAGGLLLDETSPLAAACLALLMVGAVANHVRVRHPISKSLPSLVLFVLSSYLAYELWSV